MNKTLGLINTYSTLNIGDSAIYSALAGMATNSHVVAWCGDRQPHYTPGVTFVEKLPDCDAYVSVGGDIFNNARPQLITKAFLGHLQQLSRSPQTTFLFGQSIPRSCQGISFWALSQRLKRLAAVCIRDRESHRRLKQAGVSTLLSYDSAFSLSINESAKFAATHLIEQLGVNPDRVALISLRAFDQLYGHDNQRFQNLLVQLCQQLQQRGHQPMLLMQAQAYGSDTDLAMAELVRAQIPDLPVFNPFQHPMPILANWELVMGALAIARLVIGVRYHTTVLRLATGRMAFNLYYSNKGRDLTERLGVPGCSLDQFNLADQLATIEATADQPFDDQTLRTQVRADFQACYRHI